MANYSLVLDTKFKPFSYAEMLAPVAAATQAHQAIEEEYGNLATKANVWEGMANEQTDPYAYRMYKTYANDLERQVRELAQRGLSLTSRQKMLDMKTRYSKEITPIEVAYKRREELAAEQRKAMEKDPTLFYQRYASQMSLDDFIKNPSLDYGANYSGELLAKQAGEIAENLKQALTSRGKLKGIGLPFQYEQLVQLGYTPEDIQLAITDPKNSKAAPVLNAIVDQVLESSGIYKWASSEQKTRARAYANRGLYKAIGTTNIKNFTDTFGQSVAVSARQAALDNTIRGNIPIDVHHLVSPNQLGEEGSKMTEQLRTRLGLAKTFDGKTAKWATTVDLRDLVTGKSDIFTYKFKNSSGGTTVKLFNQKGQFLNRSAVVKQGGNEADREALGKWYDSTFATMKANFRADKSGHWTAPSLLQQMNDINSGKGAITMGAMRINFGADNNKKALEALLPGLTSGDKTQIYEITSFDTKGNITKGKRASTEDFLDDKGNSKSAPMFYAAPNANTDGLIMQFNGKTYLIPRNKLGSLGEQVYNINIPQLQKANQLKQALIQRYGPYAYYDSEEGKELEQIIDNYGAAYLRAAGTTLGYSYELPKFEIQASNQTEI